MKPHTIYNVPIVINWVVVFLATLVFSQDNYPQWVRLPAFACFVINMVAVVYSIDD